MNLCQSVKRNFEVDGTRKLSFLAAGQKLLVNSYFLLYTHVNCLNEETYIYLCTFIYSFVGLYTSLQVSYLLLCLSTLFLLPLFCYSFSVTPFEWVPFIYTPIIYLSINLSVYLSLLSLSLPINTYSHRRPLRHSSSRILFCVLLILLFPVKDFPRRLDQPMENELDTQNCRSISALFFFFFLLSGMRVYKED